MDDFDRASALEAKQTEVALANHMAKQKNKVEIESAEECIECEKAIPKARQEAVKGCQYCVNCQELTDKGLL
ncbi:TraR/DksA C4-type zinc finger protein [Aliivibrio fischeri]|uniref:TraR/DksA C4-type zinc finger protein n=1 Tax=Aliivibrio fischeri TaxID=668 RepID=UPI0007C4421A|nr:TraR/DksA C4-type zinc finger protein [Aliivibrio fischeri]MBP3140133.1 TraR/DksA C4-type zinc finger protein [Aliivibrio fischeri]MBP3154515.1 TraR/DksA C4-type zinc finger protein [Aliivibrio fischeri]MCE7556379.1 TraR/DksA C4-type zinc finger protein [Aliivibrio fischeri]MCE7563056.1 TraR/DksA C4-type zinc finger protein [Aliivibrio fischeri]MCE7571348.1 TraR/DksA C4-type zinc finger protein [Aliivibrio fischeri]